MSSSTVKLVAEIGINHNGYMENVRALMAAACSAGFDFVKFQKRNVDKTTPPNKRNEPRETPWGTLPYIGYKRRLELGKKEYDAIQSLSIDLGIPWFASPWDEDSVQFLTQYPLPYIKVASPSVTDYNVLEAVKQTDRPVIISTGMSTKQEFDGALAYLGDRVEYILACTSSYPSAPNEQNLAFISTLKREYPHRRIGFSNHSPGIVFAAGAVLLGAEMVEIHITLDRAMFGSDQAASIEPSGMHRLRKYVQSFVDGIGDGKWQVFPSELAVMRSLRWKQFH